MPPALGDMLKLFKKCLTAFTFLTAAIAAWYATMRFHAKTYPVAAFEMQTDVERTAEAALRQDLLTIVTYNIAHGRGPELTQDNWNKNQIEQQERLTQIGNRIREAQADIVVLNEVDFDCNWSHRENQAHWIAKAAGLKYVIQQPNVDASLPFFRWKFGNAILSRFPTTGGQLVDLPPMSPIEDFFAGNHDAVLTEVKLSDSETIRVVGVHLEVRDEARRTACGPRLSRLLESKTPTIFAGDFNTSPGKLHTTTRPRKSTVLDRLLDGAAVQTLPVDSLAKTDMTFPSKNPDCSIDWILVPKSWTIVEKQVHAYSLSDHCMVVMRIQRQ